MTTNTAMKHEQTPDLDAVKAKHKATWEDGDYASFAKYMEAGAIEVLDGWNITPGQTLLDVGCGAGQTAIPAAKKGIRVTGVDIAENLINHARERALKLALAAQFDIGDAEQLPYADNSYDAAISVFGAMFAPQPERVTAEFARVLKPGGKLFMANWTSTGMPGQMFKCVAGFVPPPPGIPSPVLWGDEQTVMQRLGEDFTDITLTRKLYPQWQYLCSASELVDLFRTYFGPVKRAFENIDKSRHVELHEQLERIYTANSETKNGVLTITRGEYLEVVATRRK